MNVKHGSGSSGYGPGVLVELTGDEVATDLGDHGCDRSTAMHFAAIVVAGLVARGKL